MKRITYWPQSFLGISINLGAIVSWLSVTNDTNPWLMASLLTSLWSWTILYGDSAYVSYLFSLLTIKFVVA
jgi:4-hydroxybenzoate polyprenyltransferase